MWHTYVVGRDNNRGKINYVKIGKSRNPVRRINHLQTFSPTKLRPLFILEGDREKELHSRFAEYRVNGEWFEVKGELRTFIGEYVGKSGVCGPAFYTWLLNQRDRHDNVGRLAVVVSSDLTFPKTNRRLYQLLNYFQEKHPHLVHVLKQAHKEFRSEAAA